MSATRVHRVLVTGAAGFVGINVARALAARGHHVLCFDHRDPDLDARAYVGGLGSWVRGDVQDVEAVGRALESHGAEVVVHAAAVTATTPEWERERAPAVLAVNLLGTVTALQAAHAASARRVVIISSASALGPRDRDGDLIPEAAPAAPADLYGISKRAAEMVGARLAQIYPIEVVTVRLAQPYGPMERPSPDRAALSPIAEWMAAAAGGRPLTVSRLDDAKDWIYVEDVGAAFVRLVEAPRLRHAMYNLGLGADVTVRQVLAAIRRVWPGIEVSVAPEPGNPNLSAGRLRPPLEMVRLRDDLGFRPRFTIESGIARYAAWLQSAGTALPEGLA